MNTPESSSEITKEFDFHEVRTVVDRDKAQRVVNAINALTVEFPKGGNLSNLVWNTRNSYLGSPGTTYDADQVQTIVEGFLVEVEQLRSAANSDSDTNLSVTNQGE